jgi:deoxyribose-phosphate aldolase
VINDYAKYIDHTLLKPAVTSEQLLKHAGEAIEYGFATVCVNPAAVKQVKSYLSGSPVEVTSVVGFPFGANHLSIKIVEAVRAVEHGASEIDYVINLMWAADSEWKALELEAERIVAAVPKNVVVKAIIETGLHSESQIMSLTEAVVNGGVDFVKTCSGVNGGHAELQQVELMRAAGAVNIKASGGIKSLQQMERFLKAGVLRIGTSNSVHIMKEFLQEKPVGELNDY